MPCPCRFGGRVTTSAQQLPPEIRAAALIWRHLFHLVPGSIVPVAGIFAPQEMTVIAFGVLAFISLSLDLARLQTLWLNRLYIRWLAPLMKREEGHRITGATYMVIAGFIAFLLFDQTVAVSAMLFLSLGDPVASMIGRRMPGPRLFAKSPGGTAAFVGISLLVVTAMTGSGVFQYHWGLLVGAVIAGLVELTPNPLDDNLTIPLISGAVMHFLGA
jgi:acyl phosphate:glycerol-3-phosphate acyltransferase